MKSALPILILLVIEAVSCGPEAANNKSIGKSNKDTAVSLPNTPSVLDNDSLLALLSRAKRFAENYRPISSSESGIALLNNIPDSIVYSFKQLRLHGRSEYEKYLTLIFLKIYRTHLQCCHQGFELRNSIKKGNIDSLTDPLLYEFNLISNFFDNSNTIEFINSGISINWLEKNKKFLEYDEIKKEYEIFLKIYKDIDKGIYKEY